MKKLLLICLILNSIIVSGQNKKTDEILREGKLLFRLEKASWYGTDDFLAHFSHKVDSIGGYLSYESENNNIITIFFSRYNHNEILITYYFDFIPKPNPIKIDTLTRPASTEEKNLLTIRQDAVNKVSDNSDKFFKFYENTSMNFIPVINKKERKVFILTGPQKSGIVIIGNDYVLNYDSNNKFVDKSKIHNSIIQLPYKGEEGEGKITTTYHSHVVTEYISSTDICTLLLYKDYLEWTQHIVMSAKEVSIFDLEKETIFTMKTKDWEKMNKDK